MFSAYSTAFFSFPFNLVQITTTLICRSYLYIINKVVSAFSTGSLHIPYCYLCKSTGRHLSNNVIDLFSLYSYCQYTQKHYICSLFLRSSCQRTKRAHYVQWSNNLQKTLFSLRILSKKFGPKCVKNSVFSVLFTM